MTIVNVVIGWLTVGFVIAVFFGHFAWVGRERRDD